MWRRDDECFVVVGEIRVVVGVVINERTKK